MPGCGSSGEGGGPGGPGDDGGAGPSDATGGFDSPSIIQPGQDGGLGTPDGSSNCKPRSCSEAGASCGPASDGCGHIIQCGTCTAPQTCGGGGVPSQCGGTQGCVPKTCQQLGAGCGQQSDGCGSQIDCGSCPTNQSCGGGGTPNQCGAPACTPKTCQQLGINCGPAADGCGGLVMCGSCNAPQSCGGGGTPNVCGGNSGGNTDGGTDGGATDGGGGCVALTCASLGFDCGPAGDGCGGTLDCGTCTVQGQTCGGGGNPGVCGTSCVPKTCAQLNATCGTQGDGCGNTITCGTCMSPDTCGGGGVANQCGSPTCTPKTCAQLGATCGQVADGCGGLTANCGTCTSPAFCGGGGPNQCGTGTVDAGIPCTNLCPLIPNCDAGSPTAITGRVVAPTPTTFQGPNGPDPLYGALVYIPNSANGALDPFPNGVSCDQCNGAQASGSPLVSATTGPDGKFTLLNVPANMMNGPQIPLVVQLGRWRREIWIPTNTVGACQTYNVGDVRLARKQQETSPYDNIPLIAVDTGYVDALECVLQKMGIANTEFGNPPTSGAAYQAGAPRVQFYQAAPTTNGQGGAIINRSTPKETSLWSDVNVLKQYDVVLLECEGGEDAEDVTQETNMIAYADAGGRVYATHYSYTWLWDNIWNQTATIPDPQSPSTMADPITATVDTSFPKGQAFSDWLQIVGAATNPGGSPSQMSIGVTRNNVNGVNSPAQQWITAKTGSNQTGRTVPLHYTFNTPWGAQPQNQCGRVLYSDFHVNNASDHNVVFPKECSTGAMTPQEQILEFMLFDLTSCVSQDKPPPPTCTPLTCAQQGIQCGQAGDGCGNVIDCGTCVAPQTCGGGGTPSKCGGGCVPKTCAQLGISCGPAGDGCGGSLNCGTCVFPQTCGGGGTPGQCGQPACTPKTCAQQNITCGPAGDGCGNLLQCGSCPTGRSCGGGGVPGQCGTSDAGFCTAETCASQGIQCGPAGDGCGNILQCGSCPTGQSCGAGGPGKCGTSCTPLTCAQQNINCGPAGDGCGGTLSCGTCQLPQTCGGGGVSGQCGTPSCTPLTCAQQNANCGQVADGCGGTIDCGTCTSPQTCGGGGVANQCGGGIK